MQRNRIHLPAKKPRISTKGWSLDSLISSSPNFYAVDRVRVTSSELSQIIGDHERRGLPLVIEGFHNHKNWPTTMFTIDGFNENSESSDISVRNVHSWTDKVMDFSDFVSQARSISPFSEEGETERLYGKDAECPRAWDKWLQESNVLPSSLLSHGKDDEFRFRPVSSRIETLMCYLGIGDTYTPCHKDLCASSGHNLMCYTEQNGSSFWFMTEGTSAPRASAYFHKLGQELDHENHVITLEELGGAPFKVYILEQSLGDLVLVPPRSCHQVVNYGGITIKTSWSRMTLKGLITAYHHELPIYRRVGRPETYRIKSTIYYALRSRTKELEARLRSQLSESSSGLSFQNDLVKAINAAAHCQPSEILDSEVDRLAKDIKRLLALYDLILAEEMPDEELEIRQHLDSIFNDDSRIVCDFCECDIFQSFLECSQCTGGSSCSRIVCPGCYSEGRSCNCDTMQPMQCRKFLPLFDTRTEAVEVLRRYSRRAGGDDTHLYNRQEDAPRLFQAACLLLKAKKDRRAARTCSKSSNYDSHDVPFAWGLNCSQCHRSTCFVHVLKQYKIHSAEAIFSFNGDGTRKQYHQKHQSSNTSYWNKLPNVKESQIKGSPVDGLLLLVQITFQYGHCVPSNPKSLRHGWYDPVQEEEDPNHSNKSIPDIVDHDPKLTIIIPSRKGSFSATQSRNKRRQVYVDVPPIPYVKRRQILDHHSPSEPSDILPFVTKGPETLSQSRAVERNFGSNSPQHPPLTNSALTPKMTPRSPLNAKRSPQSEPVSSQKFLEDRATRNAAIGGLHFKKKPCPDPDDNDSAGIPISNFPDETSLNPSTGPPISDPRDEVFRHSPPRFVPPMEELALSAQGLSEILNIHDNSAGFNPTLLDHSMLHSAFFLHTKGQ